MTTTLTTAVTSLTGTKKVITDFHYKIALNADGSINLNESYARYLVQTLTADGKPIDDLKEWRRPVIWPNMPTVYKNALKTLHELNVTDAKNNDLIGPGTEQDDLPPPT